MKHIPKGARVAAADLLGKLVKDVVAQNTALAWLRLFCFGPFCLSRPPKNVKVRNLTTFIKDSIASFPKEGLPALPKRGRKTQTARKAKPRELRQIVSDKLSDGDVKGAIRLVIGTDSLASKSDETLAVLREKHPVRKQSQGLLGQTVVPQSTWTVSPGDISDAIRSFPSGSSGGWEGLRPQHLKDLMIYELGETGKTLRKSFAELAVMVLSGSVPEEVRPVFFGARLIALSKKDGGIRPIAVGLTIRRLIAKLCNTQVMRDAVDMFKPRQLGFGVRGGAESAVHGLRRFIDESMDSDQVIVKIDFKNAFNSLHRDHMLEEVRRHFPHAADFVSSAYSDRSALLWDQEIIWSDEGVQQGDPLGPFLFCLGIQGIVAKLQSKVNIFYMDDGTIVGDRETVVRDLQMVIDAGQSIGLVVNPSKCEFSCLSSSASFAKHVAESLETKSPGIRSIPYNHLDLLGAPLHKDSVEAGLKQKLQQLKSLTSRLSELDSHDALFLLRNSFALPRFTYLLRCAPCFDVPALLECGTFLRETLESILNCRLDDDQWAQASLPVARGGLGIRDPKDVALPAFLASVYSSRDLCMAISNIPSDAAFQVAVDKWDSSFPDRPVNELHRQKSWDRLVCDEIVKSIHAHCQSDKSKTGCFKAAEAPMSGAWLQALPIPNLGLKLSDEELRTAASLRLGTPVIQEHTCLCGGKADSKGQHALSCHKLSGRRYRHDAVNNLIQRAFNSAGVEALREPVGLSASDNLRPDGLTLVPWSRGRSLIWDFTCPHTLAESNLHPSSVKAGSAASAAETRKRKKYESLSEKYIMVPVAVESHGVWGPAAASLISALGRRISLKTGEERATTFLYQAISIEIQRGNSRLLNESYQRGELLNTEGFEVGFDVGMDNLG